MSNTKFDVIAVGNAIVDVLAKVDDEFLTQHNLAKKGMTLIDEPQAELIDNVRFLLRLAQEEFHN